MDKIKELLTRGVDTIIPSIKELETILRSGKKLRIYQGFDPTSPQLHIGHLLGLRKLKQWQELGHEVIFLIGDFTGMIGDPTGKDKTRIPLTKEQVAENAKTYKEQASKILKFEGDNAVRIEYNSAWWSKMSAQDLLEKSFYLTIGQVLERDMFQKRIKNKMEIALSEFLYPLLQAYDSVAMDVDVEIGGSDQLFNMMVGHDLVHKINKKNKFVITTPLFTDSTGAKIGKTEGNAIALTDSPNDLYAKIMALGDDVIIKGFEYLTDVSLEEIKNIEKDLNNGENPIEYKKRLAFELVKELNNKEEAEKAKEYFEKIVQQKDTSLVIKTIEVPKSFSESETVVNVLVQLKLASSRSEAKRLISQKGVAVDNKVIDDPNTLININSGPIIRVGKFNIVKIKTAH